MLLTISLGIRFVEYPKGQKIKPTLSSMAQLSWMSVLPPLSTKDSSKELSGRPNQFCKKAQANEHLAETTRIES